MSIRAHRIIQTGGLIFCAVMVLGFGFFHRDTLDGYVIRTATWTLYKSLPPAPQGPAYCPLVTAGDYGVVFPCDFQPPFVWWLRHRL